MAPAVAVSVAIRAGTLEGTQAIRVAVDRAGGTIVAAREVGAHAIALTVELRAEGLERLGRELATAGCVFLDHTDERLADAVAGATAEPSREWVALLHAAFVNEEPDRRIEVPKVPG